MKARTLKSAVSGKRPRLLANGPGRKPSGRVQRAPSEAKLKVRTIVVPVDFSPESKKALQYASKLAAKLGSGLQLVHVVEPASFVDDLPNIALLRPDQEVAKEARVRLQSLMTDEVDRSIPVQAAVRIGKPYHEIVSFAKTGDADLIVISTHGYTGLKHALLGSTAERVVRHATCPVLVVR
ncbi:MAG: universal stress protein [Verrucomicrobia subdivision 3 bacterium]|nr:universal stress protein [Limisphaerales bacterium]